MTLKITLCLDGAAFQDSALNEISRILADLASRLPDPLQVTSAIFLLHDSNGNYAGEARIEQE